MTIDENEVHRLGMLLDQSFPGARIQMVSSVINRKAVARRREFGRADEYLFFVLLGEAGPSPVELLSEWRLGDPLRKASRDDIQWVKLRRVGTGAARRDSPGCFYPLLIEDRNDHARLAVVGDVLPLGQDRTSVEVPDDYTPVWPLRADGSEGRWQMTPEKLRRLVSLGYVKLGPFRGERTAVYYLPSAEQARVESGAFVVTGRRADGSITVDSESYVPAYVPSTHWNVASHNASEHGTRLNRELIPGRPFPFPKSLYAVEDTIRFFVKEKPTSVVLDFFAGSGTTAHAVARLNRQDGGRRQSIMITNNEVSVEEAKELRGRGLRAGDPEWEALGIFEHITRPKVTAAITGKTPDGEPIAGEYKFTDEFPMAAGFEENVTFLELTYLDPDDVDLGLSFDDIAPLLWLRAGAQGSIVRRSDDTGAQLPYAWTDRYGVLFDEDRWRGFVTDRPESATSAYIVTVSPTTFAGIVAELPATIDTVRLYDTFLSMFIPERRHG